MKKINEPLSHYLPTAIRQAVEDIQVCEADPHYKIDMTNWHMPENLAGKPIVCKVCFAGATLARRNPIATYDRVISPAHVLEDQYMLLALNDIRSGCLMAALANVKLRLTCPDSDIPSYCKAPGSYVYATKLEKEEWLDNMLKIADWIEANTVRD